MDVRQLTEDFGGSLKYNHRAWITFMKTIDDLEENINRALDKLPEAHDKMAILAQCEIPDTKPEIATVLSNVYKKSKAIMRDLNLEHLIDECKEVIKALTDPSTEPGYAEIKDTATFAEAKNNIEQYLKQLISCRNELRKAWNDAEVRLLHTVKMKKCMKTAEEIMSWINDVGLVAVREPAEIADCLSKAEILKTEYETGFLSIAKKILDQSDYIKDMLEADSKKHKATNLRAFIRRFHETVEHFRKLVISKHRVYLNVYDFYLTAHKSPLSKIPVHQGCSLYEFVIQLLKWYRQTVNFVPLHLLYCEHENAFLSRYVLRGTAAWYAAVNDYLLYHPVPATEHLTKLISILPALDTKIKLQARLLIHRVKVLRSLLENCSKLEVQDVESVWKWKAQLKSGSDDISLDLDGNVLDLLNFGQSSGRSQLYRPPSVTGIRVAPKLRSTTPDRASSQQHLSLDTNVMDARKIRTRTDAHEAMEKSANLHQSSPSLFSDSGLQVNDHEGNSKRIAGLERYVSLGYVNNTVYDASDDWIQVGQPTNALPNNSGLFASLSEPHLDKPFHSGRPYWNASMLNCDTITINDVYSSHLDTEEKLDIMAKICSGDFKPNEEIYYKLKPDPWAIKSAKPQRAERRSHLVDKCAHSEPRLQTFSDPSPLLPHVMTVPAEVQPAGRHHLSDTDHRLPGRRKLYKKSSIKVEEWMQKLQNQLEMSWPQKGQKSKVKQSPVNSLRQEEDATSSQISGASPVQIGRDDPQATESLLTESDAEDLEAINKQLTELSLEEVNFEQNVLAASLQEVGRILKEQEEFLLKEQDPDLPASPVSLVSSSTSHQGEPVLAVGKSEQCCPLVNVPNINAPVDGDGMDPQHEGSLSEESGVYTQSTDSRARLSAHATSAGSSYSLGCLQAAPSAALCLTKPERLQVMNEASLGDSSSQTTVVTEICRKPSTRQNSKEAISEQQQLVSARDNQQDNSVNLGSGLQQSSYT